MQRVPRCSVFIIPKDKGKLSYFWRHAFLTAKCGPELGGVINPDTGVSIENPEGGRRTRLDFDNLKISELIERSQGGTTRVLARFGRRTARRFRGWRRWNLLAGT